MAGTYSLETSGADGTCIWARPADPVDPGIHRSAWQVQTNDHQADKLTLRSRAGVQFAVRRAAGRRDNRVHDRHSEKGGEDYILATKWARYSSGGLGQQATVISFHALNLCIYFAEI